MTSSSLPSHAQVPFAQPDIPNLLSLASYLYLLSCTSSLAGSITNAPLLGPLLTGVLLGPSLGGLLTPATQEILITLGYIGLILIVFEAGLTTHIPLLVANAALSTMAALTGVLLPITLSMAMFKGAWGFGGLQGFAAGAALCSTSLGTTIALLTPELRKTRVGSVLMAAALLDDVVGLVIAGIIAGLAGVDSEVTWKGVARPLLISIAFGLGTPVLALSLKKILQFDRLGILPKQRANAPARAPTSRHSMLHKIRVQLFITVLSLSAFVAGSRYAGTSDLFGAYLAGALLSYVFNEPRHGQTITNDNAGCALPAQACSNPTLEAFKVYLQPILVPLLEPIFFASIGTSIPVKALFTTYSEGTMKGSDVDKGFPSHRVVWRGFVYALLMVLGKVPVGLWFLVWPEPGSLPRLFGRRFQSCCDKVDTLIFKIGLSRGREEIGMKGGSLSSSNIIGPQGLSSSQDAPHTAATQLESGEGSTIPTWSECPSNSILEVKPSSGALSAAKPSSQHQGHEGHGKSKSSAMVPFHPEELTRIRGALLLGIAMVARGEIALIVAQLARPLLLGTGNISHSEGILSATDEEGFAIVIWAILISTFGGALGVGILLRTWQGKDEKRVRMESDITLGYT